METFYYMRKFQLCYSVNSLTNHIEIKLCHSTKCTTTNNWHQWQVNRQRECFSKQEPWYQNTESRLSTLDDVSEWNCNFGHAHSCCNMPNCVCHCNLHTKFDISEVSTTKSWFPYFKLNDTVWHRRCWRKQHY